MTALAIRPTPPFALCLMKKAIDGLIAACLFMLRLTKKAKVSLTATCLFTAVVGLAMLMLSPRDPNECRYGEPPHIENPDAPKLPPPIITQTVSRHAFDMIDGCGPKYNTGDFKLH